MSDEIDDNEETEFDLEARIIAEGEDLRMVVA